MRKFAHNEPIFEDGGALVDSEVIILTEEEILASYWPHWEKEMIEKYGVGHELITKENCLEDWVVVYWAWEVKDE